MSEQENEPGGPDYGGDRGGTSAGSEGGQGGQGEANAESVAKQVDDQAAQSGGVGGRSATERDGEPTTEQDADASATKSAADAPRRRRPRWKRAEQSYPAKPDETRHPK